MKANKCIEIRRLNPHRKLFLQTPKNLNYNTNVQFDKF